MAMKVAGGPRLADYPIRTIEKLRFADTDRHGHITNSVFAVCCQNARMEFLCDRRRVPTPPNTHFAIAKLVLEFRSEMYWPGTVEVGTRIERIGRSSVTLCQALFLNEICVAVAESVVVLIDATSRRSVPLPQETAEALSTNAQAGIAGVERAATWPSATRGCCGLTWSAEGCAQSWRYCAF